MRGVADFPIQRIDRPQRNSEPEFFVETFGDRGVDGAVRGTHEGRLNACGPMNGVIGVSDLFF